MLIPLPLIYNTSLHLSIIHLQVSLWQNTTREAGWCAILEHLIWGMFCERCPVT